jgi:hypothetical protein
LVPGSQLECRQPGWQELAVETLALQQPTWWQAALLEWALPGQLLRGFEGRETALLHLPVQRAERLAFDLQPCRPVWTDHSQKG